MTTTSRPTRTRGRPPGRAIWCRPAPTSTRPRATSRSRRAAGRRRSRPPTGAPSRWSCSRRWIPAAAGRRASISRRSAPASRGSASPTTIARPRCGWPRRASRCPPSRRSSGSPATTARSSSTAASSITSATCVWSSAWPARSAARLAQKPTAGARRPPAACQAGKWTKEQAAAIDAARRRSLTVVTGGPGTGKTALIGGIVRAWLADGIERDAHRDRRAHRQGGQSHRRAPRARLRRARARHAAPPARPLAAARVRLRGGEFRHHENRPLPYAAVIVDEASMVGLALMEQLSRALAPDARLVLIGDGDQLPAVEVGSVFRDLVAAVPTIRLTESHRMNPADPAGAAVLDAASAIAAGNLGSARPPAGAAPGRAGLRRVRLPGAGRRRRRSRRGARCPRSSITGTRPGSGPAPTPPRQSFALRAGRDDEIDPERRGRGHGRAGTAATVALADRHARAASPAPIGSTPIWRSAPPTDAGRAAPGGRRDPSRHPRR